MVHHRSNARARAHAPLSRLRKGSSHSKKHRHQTRSLHTYRPWCLQLRSREQRTDSKRHREYVYIFNRYWDVIGYNLQSALAARPIGIRSFRTPWLSPLLIDRSRRILRSSMVVIISIRIGMVVRVRAVAVGWMLVLSVSVLLIAERSSVVRVDLRSYWNVYELGIECSEFQRRSQTTRLKSAIGLIDVEPKVVFWHKITLRNDLIASFGVRRSGDCPRSVMVLLVPVH